MITARDGKYRIMITARDGKYRIIIKARDGKYGIIITARDGKYGRRVKERDLVRKDFAEFNKFDHFEYGTLEMLKGTFNNYSMPKLSIFMSIPDAIYLLSKISCQCS